MFSKRRIRPAAMEQNRPEFESLSDRALLELHEPDNFNTFVSSPLLELSTADCLSESPAQIALDSHPIG
jgi:hypothetical protein